MANTKVSFKRGTQEMLDAMPIVDGQLLYNIDTGETWQDVEDKRISTSGVITSPQRLSIEQQKTVRNNISALTSNGVTGAKKGDLLRVKSVDTRGVPTALEPVSVDELEGKWELIEQYEVKAPEVFDRNTTPGGERYNFRQLIFKAHIPAPYSPRVEVLLNAYYGAFIINGVIRAENADNFYYCIATVDTHGRFRFTESGSVDAGWKTAPMHMEPYDRMPNVNVLPKNEYIGRVRTGAELPAGTMIEIWGVK